MVLKGHFYLIFGEWSWKNPCLGTFYYLLHGGHLDGLERSARWLRLLLCHFHGVLLSMFNQWFWKEFLELFSVFLIAKTDLEIFYTTLVWGLTWCWLGVQWWLALVFSSLQHRKNGLEMTFLSNAEVWVWYCHDLSASCHHNIQELSWIISGILVLGNHLHPVHEETWPWKSLKEECYPLHHCLPWLWHCLCRYGVGALSARLWGPWLCSLDLCRCLCWPPILT